MEPKRSVSILSSFDFTVEHCRPKGIILNRSMTLSELANEFPLQICVTEKGRTNKEPTDHVETVCYSTKLLDNALYSKLPPFMRPNPPMLSSPSIERANKTTNEIYIFILYYFLVTEGRVPHDYDQLPPALRNLLMADKKPGDICRELASFPLSKLTHPWIRDLSRILDRRMMETIAPCVAGHRLTIPFLRYKIVRIIPIHLLESALAVRKFASRGPVWDCHPLTITQEFQAVTGDFKQNIINLIYAVFTHEQIVDMVRYRLIPPASQPNLHHQHYLSWSERTFDNFVDYVYLRPAIYPGHPGHPVHLNAVNHKTV